MNTIKRGKKFFGILLAVFILMVVKTFALHAQETLGEYCKQRYRSDNVCPETTCRLACIEEKQTQACECLAKACTDISAEVCPLDYCTLMLTCSKNTVCHYPMVGEPAVCGDLAYAGQDVSCCEGLIRRCGIEFLDGTCDMLGENSVYNLPICIPCGDGICGQFENPCNCPEDCQKEMQEVSPYTGVNFEELLFDESKEVTAEELSINGS